MPEEGRAGRTPNLSGAPTQGVCRVRQGCLSREMGAHRPGELLCALCREDPLQIVKLLLEQARRGDRDLLPIRGYTLLEELGRGGMGAVYRVRHDRTGEEVALKIMLPQIAVHEQAKGSFLREVEITRALEHPYVVQLQESGCSNGTFFFTLEYCDGGSVARLMRERGGKLSINEAGRIILQALDGLEYAHNAEISVRLPDGSLVHRQGVVHRDLKPANLLLSGSGISRIAKVGDYGLAKAFDAAGLGGQTRTGTKAGSPWFMPRQQVIHFKYAGPEVDVWAMAASLYNMLTGCFPRDFPPGGDRWQVGQAAAEALEGHTGSVTSVSFSSDGRYALSGSWDETVRLWEVASGRELRRFEGHTGWVYSVSFSPDGCYALSGSGDIKLWEVESGRELRQFEGHTERVCSVCFSPDGRYILSGGADCTVRLWEVASGREVRPFEGHVKGVISINFSPDGRYALSGSDDQTVRLWEFDWEWEFPGPAVLDEGTIHTKNVREKLSMPHPTQEQETETAQTSPLRERLRRWLKKGRSESK